MTKEMENKFIMSTAMTDALSKAKEGVGEKFEKTYKATLKAEFEKRREECVDALDLLINGILSELSKIKIFTEEINRIDELLESQED